MDEYNVVAREIKKVGRFKIVCDEILDNNNKRYPYSYVQINNCAATLCVIEESVILIRQYRHTLRSWEYEIPAGSIESGEEPAVAAEREVKEEIGFKVKEMIPLGWYHLSVGSTTEKVYLFYAECLENVGQNLDALEKLEVCRVSFDEFEKMIDANEFHQCMGVTAWERFKAKNIKGLRDSPWG